MGRKAGRGLRWALSGTVLIKLGSFAMGLVLVRLIAPHDFGLYAVALAANAFVIHVNDMGIIAATVQWRGRGRGDGPDRSHPRARVQHRVVRVVLGGGARIGPTGWQP